MNRATVDSFPIRFFRIVTEEGVSEIGLTAVDLNRLGIIPYSWMEPGKIKHRVDCVGSLAAWSMWRDSADDVITLTSSGESSPFRRGYF